MASFLSARIDCAPCIRLVHMIPQATWFTVPRTVAGKYCVGVVPDVPVIRSARSILANIIEQYTSRMENCELEDGVTLAVGVFRDGNGYLTAEAPRLSTGDEFRENCMPSLSN